MTTTPQTYQTYDARQQAHHYYQQAYPHNPNHHLKTDINHAQKSGVLIWTPTLILISWNHPGAEQGTLWIELAIGYLSLIAPMLKLPHNYHTLKYQRHGKTVTRNALHLAKHIT